MIDYTAVDEKLREDVLDGKAVRGIFEGSNHYAVLDKIKMKGRWDYSRKHCMEKIRD